MARDLGHAWRVEQHKLRVLLGEHNIDTTTRRMGAGRDVRDGFAHQTVDEGRFPGIRPTDHGDAQESRLFWLCERRLDLRQSKDGQVDIRYACCIVDTPRQSKVLYRI